MDTVSEESGLPGQGIDTLLSHCAPVKNNPLSI